MAAKNDRRVRNLSCTVRDESGAEIEAMDGAAAKGSPESVVTIVVDTHFGRVISQPLPESAAMAIKESLEGGMARLQQLRIDTRDGVVLIPGELLRRSLISFNRGRIKSKTHALDWGFGDQHPFPELAIALRKTRKRASDKHAPDHPH